MRKTAAALLALFLALLSSLSAFAELDIRFLSIGQGDCTIVLCDGESMVIDGGPASASGFLYSYIINDLKLTHVDYVISTHPHVDHVGGLAAVLSSVPVDLVLSPVTEWDSKRFSNMLKQARKQGAPVTVPGEGDTLRLGGATVTVLHCWPEAGSYTGTNDMSIVVRIDYGERSVIVTGDAEETSEYMMIDSGLPLKADVLRVAHHGSYSATTDEFLDAVSPAYAVISCGRNNSYEHPHQVVLNRLKAHGVRVFRTDLQGTVRCVSDGKDLRFETEKETRKDLYVSPGNE